VIARNSASLRKVLDARGERGKKFKGNKKKDQKKGKQPSEERALSDLRGKK